MTCKFFSLIFGTFHQKKMANAKDFMTLAILVAVLPFAVWWQIQWLTKTT
jgi:diacylglycerol kinase